MNWIDFLAVLCLALYAVASVAALMGLLAHNNRANRVALLVTLAAFALHSGLLLADIAMPAWQTPSRNSYLPALAWGLMAICLAMRWKLRFNGLLLFATPLAFLLLFAALLPGTASPALPETLTGPLFFLHLVGVSAGIGLMAVAAGAAVVFLWQEHSLKAKKGKTFRHDIPALSALDRINAVATAIGFPAYTVGILCGFIWARVAWGTLLSGDPKELLTVAIWLVYAVLFHQRQVLGWQGRKPALLALGILAASLFSLFIVNTLFPTHHSFDVLG